MYLKTIFREGLERKIAVRVFFAVHRLSTAKNAASAISNRQIILPSKRKRSQLLRRVAFASQSFASHKRYLFTIKQGEDNTIRRINVNSLRV